MSTPISEPIDKFLHLVEKDIDFFRYFDLSDSAAMALAQSRASYLLDEALERIMIRANPPVDLTARDEGTGDISVDLNHQESAMIPSMMYEIYLERDFSYLKTLNVNYTRTELRVFDPSNARSTFLAIYDRVKARNDEYIDLYKNTDRNTGQFKLINYGAYDGE